jgi:acyl-CoA thioester hydrolase
MTRMVWAICTGPRGIIAGRASAAVNASAMDLSSLAQATHWDHPQPHLHTVAVLPAHIDVMQHTNNVVYLQWLEDIAWAHSQALGLGPQEYRAHGHGMVVRQHELNYLAATRLGDHLVLATWLVAADRLTLTRTFQYWRPADGVTVFRARTQYVCVDIALGRVRRMPPVFHDTYHAALTSPTTL